MKIYIWDSCHKHRLLVYTGTEADIREVCVYQIIIMLKLIG